MNSPILSIVVPIFNEQESILSFVAKVLKSTDMFKTREIILVDDGSTDGTPKLLAGLLKKHREISIVTLQNNSGHMAALTAGLSASKGKWVVTIDADGQDDPGLIPKMVEACETNKVDVCYMQRSDRKQDPLRHRIFSPIFYRMLSLSTNGKTPYQSADFRLISRNVVNVLLSLPESRKVFRVLIPTLGFRSVTLKYNRKVRLNGKSKYGFSKLAKLGLNSILATSGAPLRWVSSISIVLGFTSLFYSFFVLLNGLFTNNVPGWASLAFMISTLFLFQAIATMVICEFLLIILADIRQRPLCQIVKN